MPRYLHKNKNINRQDYMCPPEPSNFTKEDPSKCNVVEVQDKDCKIVIINMFMNLKEDIKTQTLE